jgi:NADH:ubiquinone oxidoreductase subunit 5 (subunit L)/multisubunit Na+/H+ antiporter MnhA subunit
MINFLEPSIILYLSIFIPIIAAPLIYILGKINAKIFGRILSIISSFLSLFFILNILPELTHSPKTIFSLIELKFILNDVSWLFSFIASFMGFLCLLYSIHYMPMNSEDERYFSLMTLFIGVMVGISFCDDILLFLILWELLSFCSYALIQHRLYPLAVKGAFKTIIITEIGSITLILSSMLFFRDYRSISLIIGLIPTGALDIMGILLLIAAMTKSVQIPFYVWLPDAMEAPTPVSALLHSATIVKAGALLLFKFWPLLSKSYIIPFITLIIGLITMIIGALNALIENDAKRMLAFSTISHIGCIFFALGLNTELSFRVALLYVLMHAIFKSLLFLGIGGVEHVTNTRDMKSLGGLLSNMPTTGWSFIIGALSASALPGFNGFIAEFFLCLAALYKGGIFGIIGLGITLIVGALTLAYFAKTIQSIFLGAKPAGIIVHEVGLFMRIPMIILSVLSLLLGIIPHISLIIVGQYIAINIESIISIIALLIVSLLVGLILIRPAKWLREEGSKPFMGGEDYFDKSFLNVQVASHHFFDWLNESIRWFYKYTDCNRIFIYTYRAIEHISSIDKIIIKILIFLLVLILVIPVILGW